MYSIPRVVTFGVVFFMLMVGEGFTNSAPSSNDIDKVLEFKNEMKKIGSYGSIRFSCKSWGVMEKEIIKNSFQEVKFLAPGLFQRAILYRPIQLFRTSHLGLDSAFAEADYIRNGIIFPDKFFQPKYEKETISILIHEMVHLVKPYYRGSLDESWYELIRPRFERVLRVLKEKEVSFNFQCKTIAQGKEVDKRFNYLAIQEGLPALYAFQNYNEALTVSVEYMFKGFQLPNDIKAFINKHYLSTPYQLDPMVLNYSQALDLYAEGKFNESIEAFARLQTVDPDFSQIYSSHRRLALMAKGDLDQVISEVIKFEKKSYGNLLLLGDLYKWKNNYNEALKYYSEAIKANPTVKDGYLARGHIWSLKSEHDQAVGDYTKAIEICPGLTESYLSRANTLSNKKDYEKAMQDYNEILSRDPQNSRAYSGRGNIQSKQKKWIEAVSDYTKIIDQNPKDFNAYVERGKSRIGAKDFSGAITDFNTAVKILPLFFPEILFYRGQAYVEVGEYQKGIADLNKAKGMSTLKKDAEEWIRKAEEALAKKK